LLEPPDIVRGAEAGDSAAGAALARYEQRMARALASIINVLDPEVIVLGGGLSNIDRLYDQVPRLWGEYVFGATTARRLEGEDTRRHAAVRTRLVRAQHGDASGVRGAAWLWGDHGTTVTSRVGSLDP
jgi:predicted NBD/HSP70 family sugar kinase